MWGRHKPEDHRIDFRQSKGTPSSRPSTAPPDPLRTDFSQKPTVQVDNNMFQALKSGADIQVFLNRLAANNTTTLN